MTAAPERSAQVGEQRWTALREALAWLAHPVSLGSIAVLVVNDHVLKGAYGNWWTGKLSDFAGLIFFPSLLAVAFAVCAPRVPFRSLAIVSVVTTGVGFAWVKATEIGATTASAVWTVAAGPSVLLRDTTDLIALPMLAVAAALVVRGRPRPRALMAAIALPFAVLGTVATSQTFEPAAWISEDDSGEAVVVVDHGAPHAGVVYRYNGTHWMWDSGAPTIFIDNLVVASFACVPENPDECFQPLARGIGVERSTDGGATWQVDWKLSEDELRIIWSAYVMSDYTLDSAFSTNGVAVLPSAEGFRVVAANGYDGLAVRDESGNWEREGWIHIEYAEHLDIARLDGSLHPWQSEGLLRWPLAWAMVAFGLGFMALVASSPRTVWRESTLVIMGATLVVGGLFLGGAGIYVNFGATERMPGHDTLFASALPIAFLIAVGLVGAALMSLLMISAPRQVLIRSLGFAAFVAALVASTVALSPPVPVVKAVVAGVAFLLGTASGAFLQRSPATRKWLGRGWRKVLTRLPAKRPKVTE